jgi:mannose-1-phosphate guanylyltransferase
MIVPVVIAGGSGTRLWPLSRTHYPKQFLPLTGEQSLLQQTLLRLKGLEHDPAIIICNEAHRFLTAEQVRLSEISHSPIILEPEGRNTAPAIALAAFKALETNLDATLLVMPADHDIADVEVFLDAVTQAAVSAENGKLVTFGIEPTSAHTGYGYIQKGQSLERGFTVKQFVEKPDKATAKGYVESGQYVWNSGIFMFKAQVYLDMLKRFNNDIFEACSNAMQSQQDDLDFTRINSSAFLACPSDSIDYAIMEPLTAEQNDAVVMFPMAANWSDVGSFDALWQLLDKDEQQNATRGDVIAIDTQGSLLLSENKLLATVGVKDVVVVQTKDAVLIADKKNTQAIKQVVAQLEQKSRAEIHQHREVYRPWGKFDAIDEGERFLVKRITVNPGARLSMQMHHHRAEHWVVVSGTAKVTLDNKVQYVTENQSVYIPITAVHSLENPGKTALELIEVQSGSFLDESDIVRFEDDYGRK